MLRNRALSVQLVKKTDDDKTPLGLENIDSEKIVKITTEIMTAAAITVVVSVGAVIGIKTISTIAINVTNPANWR